MQSHLFFFFSRFLYSYFLNTAVKEKRIQDKSNERAACATTCFACEASAQVLIASSLSVLWTLQNMSRHQREIRHKNARAMPSRRGISSFKRNSLNFFSSLCLLRFQDVANAAISSTELHTCYRRYMMKSKND
jgi:hypothetical protein